VRVKFDPHLLLIKPPPPPPPEGGGAFSPPDSWECKGWDRGEATTTVATSSSPLVTRCPPWDVSPMATVAARPPHTLPHAAPHKILTSHPSDSPRHLVRGRGACGCWYNIRDRPCEIFVHIGYGTRLPPAMPDVALVPLPPEHPSRPTRVCILAYVAGSPVTGSRRACGLLACMSVVSGLGSRGRHETSRMGAP